MSGHPAHLQAIASAWTKKVEPFIFPRRLNLLRCCYCACFEASVEAIRRHGERIGSGSYIFKLLFSQKSLRKEKVEPSKKKKRMQTNFKETWALSHFWARISQAGVRVLSQKPKFSRPIYDCFRCIKIQENLFQNQ